MSWLSKILNKKAGIPEVNLSKDKDALVAALAEEVARGKTGELLRKLPDNVFYSLFTAFKDEATRRAAG